MSQETTKLPSPICESMAADSFALKLLDASLNGLYVYDVKLGRNIFINAQYTRLTGYTLNELQAMDEAQFFALFHPEDQQRVADHMERILLKSDDELEIEYRFKTKDGRWVWCLSRDSAFARNEDGTVSQFIGTFFDINGRKQLEGNAEQLAAAAIRERDHLEALINSISDEIWFASSEGKFTLVNPSAALQFEMDEMDETDGIDVKKLAERLEVFRPDGSPRPVEESPPLRALQGEVVRNLEEIIRIPSTGELRYRQVSSTPVIDKTGSIIGSVSVVRDITERKQAEEALKSSRLRAETEKRYLEAIFQVLPVGLVVTDTKGGVIRTNNMDKKIWGLRPNTRDVDDYVQYKAWWADSGKPIESQEWASAQAVLIGKSVIGQVLKIKRFNGEHGYIINSAAPIFNDEGRVSGSAVVIQDITELRRAEQAKLESIQNLNEYAYALTHNLKAPFRAIQNYAEFLTEDLEDILEWEPKQYLEGLKKAVTQANNQFRDLEILYEIANRHINIETFDMKEVLNEMQSTFQDVSDSQLILHKNWPAFRGERHLIRQILINLIDNGFKFNRADVKRVEVGWQAVEGNRIEIFVRDNGIGIDPQYQVQIFDIFKRLHTDREYGGTGIGLAIVKKALQKIGGEMRLTSAIGEGSTFYINLPNTFLENNQA